MCFVGIPAAHMWLSRNHYTDDYTYAHILHIFFSSFQQQSSKIVQPTLFIYAFNLYISGEARNSSFSPHPSSFALEDLTEIKRKEREFVPSWLTAGPSLIARVIKEIPLYPIWHFLLLLQTTSLGSYLLISAPAPFTSNVLSDIQQTDTYKHHAIYSSWK